MIPIIESEVVERHKWISKSEFVDTVAIAQSCPGVFAINLSVFIGYKMRKVKGAIFPWQNGWYPRSRRQDECTPWLEAFVNARKWIEEKLKN